MNRIEILSLPRNSSSKLSEPGLAQLFDSSLQIVQQPQTLQLPDTLLHSPHHHQPHIIRHESHYQEQQQQQQQQQQQHQLQQQHRQQQTSSSPIMRLPVDILLYIASPRFLSLNDIMQWRTTASTFYHSIPLPHATLILQASHLFQIRPRRSRIQPPLSDRSSSLPPQSQPDIHSLYKDRQLNDIIARLTRILTHPEFQPRLMRSSYSFRHHIIDVPHHQVRQRPQRTGARITADNQPSIHQYYAEAVFKRTKRRRRDLLDYPIFTTGDPPDLVRLAIEFGYTPFVDHLLHRGFRPRDLPEYFSMIPFLPVETITTVPDHEATIVDNNIHYKSKDQLRCPSEDRTKVRSEILLQKKSLEELNCIWGCMRVSNQELMESCSRADLDAVFKVLDATLISPRPSLDVLKSAQSDREHSAASKVDKGKQRHSCYDEGWIHHDHRHDSMSVEPAAHRLGEDDMMFAAGVGAGPSVSQQASSLHSRSRTVIAEDIASAPIEQNVPVIMPMPPEASGLSTAYGPTYRSAIFQSRQRVDSDSSLEQYSPLSDQGRSESKLHMPWVDGRALTSALLAICFRRDGYGSEEAEALEESRAVPIVSEILKYDCMLTAQALGQAVLGAAYSRSPGSLKRAQERRQQFLRKQRYDQRGPSSSSNSQPNPASQKSLDSREYLGDGKGSICVMDLLMERIGPREWLKLIKYYLQRQEFDDLSVVLDLCPFKSSHLETKDKDLHLEYRHHSRAGSGHLLSNFQQDHRRQQARELICREAGICGIGTRLSYFNGQGIGQASYNVSSTLHNASRTLFTGSGTRFTNSYMLPRGGFRGFGGNSSSHSSSVENAGNYEAGSGEPFNSHSEEEGLRSTSAIETDALFGSEGHWQPAIDTDYVVSVGDGRSHAEMNRIVDPMDYENGGFEEPDAEPFNNQDSNLAFGSIGSSTTSSSRPGPGIVGIAIQVQAPEHIVKALLKMGFRFFSICDLSTSDDHHPLALQFREQERMNRQLIEFCMSPSVESLKVSAGGLGGEQGSKAKGLKMLDRARHEPQYDAADRKYYARVVENFLFPRSSKQARRSSSASVLLSQIHHLGSGSNTNIIGSKERRQQQRQQQEQEWMQEQPISATLTSTAIAEAPTCLAQTSSSAQPPSDRSQFVLAPIQLGESIEQITSAINYLGLDVGSAHQASGSCSPIYQRALDETTEHRVRECLRSEYIDLMTVGICLYQTCFHKKELLLKVLLDHRLLIAQDALSGAVQVAASVGWKRGLEILLMENGDMEADIDPVVTTTSEHVHHATSMKWDHATAMASVQISKPKVNSFKNSYIATGNDIQRGIRRARAATIDGTLGEQPQRHRGHRRHRSDSSQLHLSRAIVGNSNTIQMMGNSNNTRGGIEVSSNIGASRPGSHGMSGINCSNIGIASSITTRLSSYPPFILSPPPVQGPVIPSIRTSSLRTKLSSFLPNLPSKLHQQEGKQNQKHCHDEIRSQTITSKNHQEKVSATPKLPPAMTMLSSSGLWHLPSVMMQRKNKNAVIALMAATTRNDPYLVHWLIESFADIKIAHIMQALMIACDRGSIRVVQALIGESMKAAPDCKPKRSEGENSEGRDVMSRLLFRRWLGFQFQKTLEMTVLTQGPTAALASNNNNDNHPSHPQFNSFPFLFLMESSPTFRHYHQILNTLSSCQFMNQKGEGHQRPQSLFSSSVATEIRPQASGSLGNGSNPDMGRPQQEQQQKLPSRRTKSPCETKLEIIHILLEPLLETFGPISLRKALDKVPEDCWWPVDHDVRLAADREARKSMLSTVAAMKKQQKGLQSHFKRQEKRKQKQQQLPDDQQQMQTQKQKSKRHFFKNRVKPQKHQTRPSPIMDEKEESEGIDGQRSRWHNKIKRWVLLKKSAKAEIPSVTTAIVLEPNRTEVVNREYEGKANEIGATATTSTPIKSIFKRLSFVST